MFVYLFLGQLIGYYLKFIFDHLGQTGNVLYTRQYLYFIFECFLCKLLLFFFCRLTLLVPRTTIFVTIACIC